MCDCGNLPAFLAFFFRGKTLKSFSLPIYQNIKWRWEAHCLVVISHGWSPFNITQLCLICLRRCSRGTQVHWMLMFSGMWNLTADSFQQLHFFTPPALFLHVNGETIHVSRSSANSKGMLMRGIVHLGGEEEEENEDCFNAVFGLPFGEITWNNSFNSGSHWIYSINI